MPFIRMRFFLCGRNGEKKIIFAGGEVSFFSGVSNSDTAGLNQEYYRPNSGKGLPSGNSILLYEASINHLRNMVEIIDEER